MNRAEFMARAILALGTNEEHWQQGVHGMRDPKDCVERAEKLWEAYAQALGIDPRDAGSAAGNPDVFRVGERLQEKLAHLQRAANNGTPGLAVNVELLRAYVSGLTGAAFKAGP